MPYPTFTTQDIADFSGRDIDSYPTPFSTMALTQAVLLFKIATGITDDLYPTDPQSSQIAQLGILGLADELILQQPYQQVIASPLNSEGVGSYHYTKTLSRANTAVNAQVNQGNAFAKMARAAVMGSVTGCMWFDIAMNTLGRNNTAQSLFTHGGIEVFEHDEYLVQGRGLNRRMLAPSDLNLWDFSMGAIGAVGWDPNQGYYNPTVYVAGPPQPSTTPASIEAGSAVPADEQSDYFA